VVLFVFFLRGHAINKMEFNEGAPKLARKLASKRAPKVPQRILGGRIGISRGRLRGSSRAYIEFHFINGVEGKCP